MKIGSKYFYLAFLITHNVLYIFSAARIGLLKRYTLLQFRIF
jgi:hypothetical protein